MIRPTFAPAVAVLGIVLSGCTVLPHSGPSISAMTENTLVNLVNVTPTMANDMHAQLVATEQDQVTKAVNRLNALQYNQSLVFKPGDSLAVTLWSFSSSQSGSGQVTTQSDGPSPSQLGNFTIAEDGTISLPYVGTVYIAGMGLSVAQNTIASRYSGQGIVQRPYIIITPISIPQGSIIVTGYVGSPKLIQWTPAGIDLDVAITDALGNGAGLFSDGSDLAMSKSTVQVDIVRNSEPPVSIPLDVAMEQTIPLQPNDKVIVRKAESVKVVVLGDGLKKDGFLGYGEPPTLSDVLADSSGLDGYVANDRAVFVMRELAGQKPVLYDFAWNHIDGVIASQQFPMQNGDLVYVAEAPIVSVEKVVNILFQIAVPIQAAK